MWLQGDIVYSFSQIATPMYLLLCLMLSSSGWTSVVLHLNTCRSCLHEDVAYMKTLLTSPPVLSSPGFTKQFVLHIGANGEGLGANYQLEARE